MDDFTALNLVQNLQDTVQGTPQYPGLFEGEIYLKKIELSADGKQGTVYFHYTGQSKLDYVARLIGSTLHPVYANWKITNWDASNNDYILRKKINNTIIISFRKEK